MAKILVVRFSSIGDIVLTTPVVRMLANAGHEVFYITKKQYAGILENNPYINKVFSLSDNFDDVLNEIKNENIDHIIDLHRNLRTLRVRLALRKPVSAFNKLNLRKWLLTNLKINAMPKVHIVDRYLQAARDFIGENDGEGLDYFVNDDGFPAELKEAGMKPEKFVALAIGGQHATKRMPIGKLMEICDKLMFPVVLLGGKEDAETGHQLSLLSVNTVIDLCGKVSLGTSAQVIKHCGAIITHDTGMMHIAAAYRRNIVSVWGNTVPEFGMYPYLPEEYRQRSVIIEKENLRCRPCSKIGYKDCPKGHFKCMQQIDTDDIVAAVQELVVGF